MNNVVLWVLMALLTVGVLAFGFAVGHGCIGH
jgi:hypothetical protein